MRRGRASVTWPTFVQRSSASQRPSPSPSGAPASHCGDSVQSSEPVAGRKAVKKSPPPTGVICAGREPSGPGFASASRTVPPAVPSERQSSAPVPGSLAEK